MAKVQPKQTQRLVTARVLRSVAAAMLPFYRKNCRKPQLCQAMDNRYCHCRPGPDGQLAPQYPRTC
ncbi:hypothetical protein ACFTAO_19200 [Paenibacillus rhizoplanae]